MEASTDTCFRKCIAAPYSSPAPCSPSFLSSFFSLPQSPLPEALLLASQTEDQVQPCISQAEKASAFRLGQSTRDRRGNGLRPELSCDAFRPGKPEVTRAQWDTAHTQLHRDLRWSQGPSCLQVKLSGAAERGRKWASVTLKARRHLAVHWEAGPSFLQPLAGTSQLALGALRPEIVQDSCYWRQVEPIPLSLSLPAPGQSRHHLPTCPHLP